MYILPLQATSLLYIQSLVAIVIVLVILGLFATYLTSYFESERCRSEGLKGKRVEPPQAPYAIPWLANTLSFAWDTEGYIWRMQLSLAHVFPSYQGIA